MDFYRLEYYMDKCMSLERELQFTQNQLALWKSKSEIIRLLENELEGLRRIIKEKDRNIDMERAIQKVIFFAVSNFANFFRKGQILKRRRGTFKMRT